MSVIPEGYKLSKHCNRTIVESDEYKAWTVSDIREIMADLPDNATVWWSTFDPDIDDMRVHPVEFASSHGAGKNPYVLFG